MKRVALIVAVLVGTAGLSYANCVSDLAGGVLCDEVLGQLPPGPQGPQGNPGPQGDQGLQGNPGANGTDGQSGKDGSNGKDGRNGKDATVNRHFAESNLVADTAVRLYDGKRFQFQAFNVYAFGRHRGDDIFGDGRNMMYGMRMVLKLGKSHEERMISKQDKEIAALRAQVAALLATKTNEVTFSAQ